MMTRGEMVHLSGYELMAAIDYSSGGAVAVVVHNGSTHILLFVVTERGIGPLMAHTGRYIDNFRYDDSDINYQYRRALDRAIGVALGDFSDA